MALVLYHSRIHFFKISINSFDPNTNKGPASQCEAKEDQWFNNYHKQHFYLPNAYGNDWVDKKIFYTYDIKFIVLYSF